MDFKPRRVVLAFSGNKRIESRAWNPSDKTKAPYAGYFIEQIPRFHVGQELMAREATVGCIGGAGALEPLKGLRKSAGNLCFDAFRTAVKLHLCVGVQPLLEPQHQRRGCQQAQQLRTCSQSYRNAGIKRGALGARFACIGSRGGQRT